MLIVSRHTITPILSLLLIPSKALQISTLGPSTLLSQLPQYEYPYHWHPSNLLSKLATPEGRYLVHVGIANCGVS
jgi:hypothetical protein